MTILDLLDERARRLEADIAFAIAVLQIPKEWIPRLLHVIQSDGAVTLYVGDVLISRHAFRSTFDPDAYVIALESTWFGGMPGTDIQRVIERVDREEAQDLDDHCRSLTPQVSVFHLRGSR